MTYVFPPVGGAGVQRATKFAKYLPTFGWQTSILTPSNPSVPALDTSLGADVPRDTIVCRAKTLEPGYGVKSLVSAGTTPQGPETARMSRGVKVAARRVVSMLLQPDPQVLWYPNAVKAGKRLVRSVPHDAILATGPPFSCFLVAAALHRVSGLPLVLDYRDEWELTNRFQENKQFGRVAQWLNSTLERRIARRASLIVATSEASARSLESVRDRSGSQAPVCCIRNGFDPDDFTHAFSEDEPTPRSHFRLVYAGTLFRQTSVQPLVDAVRRLCEGDPDLGSRLELVFAGRRTPEQEAIIDSLSGLPTRVVLHPYLDHTAAVQLMRSADLLCSILADAPGAARALTAKIFEYMAARRPILAITPPGDLWDVLEGYPAADRVLPSEVDVIAASLTTRLRAWKGGSVVPLVDWNDARYDRREQAKELATLLSQLAGDRRGLR